MKNSGQNRKERDKVEMKCENLNKLQTIQIAKEALIGKTAECTINGEKHEVEFISRGIHHYARDIFGEKNIFWVKNDILYTPSLSLGIVKGITREWVMTLAREIGFEVREGEFDRQEVESAHECFLTNAIDEIIPLSQIGNARFAGNEGPVYRRLHEAYVYILEQQL